MENFRDTLNAIKQTLEQNPELKAPLYYWLCMTKGSFINPFLKDLDTKS